MKYCLLSKLGGGEAMLPQIVLGPPSRTNSTRKGPSAEGAWSPFFPFFTIFPRLLPLTSFFFTSKEPTLVNAFPQYWLTISQHTQ